MKKSVLLRVVVLTGGVLMLLQGPRSLRSQIISQNHECYTAWNTYNDYCDNCCQNWATPFTTINYETNKNVGQLSSMYVQASCGGAILPGTPDYCTNSYCGTFDYDTTYVDSSCCQVGGEVCDENDDCCAWYSDGGVCNSSGICATCISNGSSITCGAANDCCSGNCFNGSCCSPSFLQECGYCGRYACNGSCNDPCSADNGGGECDGAGSCEGCVEEGGSCVFDCDCQFDSCEQLDGICGPPLEDPIVVDLTGAGFPLTNQRNGVKFDFLGTGNPTQMAWTAAGSSVAWLALDRNGNGRIDDGAELFSNVAPQPDSPLRTKLGFLALAVYDQPANGGNGDGVIDRRDVVFPKLLLWVDRNHNGVSDPGELLTMQQAGIQSISVHYEFSNWTDAYGNEFRYRSRIVFASGGPTGDQYAYDVVLAPSSAGAPRRALR